MVLIFGSSRETELNAAAGVGGGFWIGSQLEYGESLSGHTVHLCVNYRTLHRLSIAAYPVLICLSMTMWVIQGLLALAKLLLESGEKKRKKTA